MRPGQHLYTRAEGLAIYAELHAYIHTEISPAVVAYSELFDCSGATTKITGAEIRRLAGEGQVINKEQRPDPVAVVATDNVFHGLFRMFDVLTEHSPSHSSLSRRARGRAMARQDAGYREDS